MIKIPGRFDLVILPPAGAKGSRPANAGGTALGAPALVAPATAPLGSAPASGAISPGAVAALPDPAGGAANVSARSGAPLAAGANAVYCTVGGVNITRDRLTATRASIDDKALSSVDESDAACADLRAIASELALPAGPQEESIAEMRARIDNQLKLARAAASINDLRALDKFKRRLEAFDRARDWLALDVACALGAMAEALHFDPQRASALFEGDVALHYNSVHDAFVAARAAEMHSSGAALEEDVAAFVTEATLAPLAKALSKVMRATGEGQEMMAAIPVLEIMRARFGVDDLAAVRDRITHDEALGRALRVSAVTGLPLTVMKLLVGERERPEIAEDAAALLARVPALEDASPSDGLALDFDATQKLTITFKADAGPARRAVTALRTAVATGHLIIRWKEGVLVAARDKIGPPTAAEHAALENLLDLGMAEAQAFSEELEKSYRDGGARDYATLAGAHQSRVWFGDAADALFDDAPFVLFALIRAANLDLMAGVPLAEVLERFDRMGLPAPLRDDLDKTLLGVRSVLAAFAVPRAEGEETIALTGVTDLSSTTASAPSAMIEWLQRCLWMTHRISKEPEHYGVLDQATREFLRKILPRAASVTLDRETVANLLVMMSRGGASRAQIQSVGELILGHPALLRLTPEQQAQVDPVRFVLAILKIQGHAVNLDDPAPDESLVNALAAIQGQSIDDAMIERARGLALPRYDDATLQRLLGARIMCIGNRLRGAKFIIGGRFSEAATKAKMRAISGQSVVHAHALSDAGLFAVKHSTAALKIFFRAFPYLRVGIVPPPEAMGLAVGRPIDSDIDAQTLREIQDYVCDDPETAVLSPDRASELSAHFSAVIAALENPEGERGVRIRNLRDKLPASDPLAEHYNPVIDTLASMLQTVRAHVIPDDPASARLAGEQASLNPVGARPAASQIAFRLLFGAERYPAALSAMDLLSLDTLADRLRQVPAATQGDNPRIAEFLQKHKAHAERLKRAREALATGALRVVDDHAEVVPPTRSDRADLEAAARDALETLYAAADVVDFDRVRTTIAATPYRHFWTTFSSYLGRLQGSSDKVSLNLVDEPTVARVKCDLAAAGAMPWPSEVVNEMSLDDHGAKLTYHPGFTAAREAWLDVDKKFIDAVLAKHRELAGKAYFRGAAENGPAPVEFPENRHAVEVLQELSDRLGAGEFNGRLPSLNLSFADVDPKVRVAKMVLQQMIRDIATTSATHRERAAATEYRQRLVGHDDEALGTRAGGFLVLQGLISGADLVAQTKSPDALTPPMLKGLAMLAEIAASIEQSTAAVLEKKDSHRARELRDAAKQLLTFTGEVNLSDPSQAKIASLVRTVLRACDEQIISSRAITTVRFSDLLAGFGDHVLIRERAGGIVAEGEETLTAIVAGQTSRQANVIDDIARVPAVSELGHVAKLAKDDAVDAFYRAGLSARAAVEFYKNLRRDLTSAPLDIDAKRALETMIDTLLANIIFMHLSVQADFSIALAAKVRRAWLKWYNAINTTEEEAAWNELLAVARAAGLNAEMITAFVTGVGFLQDAGNDFSAGDTSTGVGKVLGTSWFAFRAAQHAARAARRGTHRLMVRGKPYTVVHEVSQVVRASAPRGALARIAQVSLKVAGNIVKAGWDPIEAYANAYKFAKQHVGRADVVVSVSTEAALGDFALSDEIIKRLAADPSFKHYVDIGVQSDIDAIYARVNQALDKELKDIAKKTKREVRLAPEVRSAVVEDRARVAMAQPGSHIRRVTLDRDSLDQLCDKLGFDEGTGRLDPSLAKRLGIAGPDEAKLAKSFAKVARQVATEAAKIVEHVAEASHAGTPAVTVAQMNALNPRDLIQPRYEVNEPLPGGGRVIYRGELPTPGREPWQIVESADGEMKVFVEKVNAGSDVRVALDVSGERFGASMKNAASFAARERAYFMSKYGVTEPALVDELRRVEEGYRGLKERLARPEPLSDAEMAGLDTLEKMADAALEAAEKRIAEAATKPRPQRGVPLRGLAGKLADLRRAAVDVFNDFKAGLQRDLTRAKVFAGRLEAELRAQPSLAGKAVAATTTTTRTLVRNAASGLWEERVNLGVLVIIEGMRFVFDVGRHHERADLSFTQKLKLDAYDGAVHLGVVGLGALLTLAVKKIVSYVPRLVEAVKPAAGTAAVLLLGHLADSLGADRDDVRADDDVLASARKFQSLGVPELAYFDLDSDDFNDGDARALREQETYAHRPQQEFWFARKAGAGAHQARLAQFFANVPAIASSSKRVGVMTVDQIPSGHYREPRWIFRDLLEALPRHVNEPRYAHYAAAEIGGTTLARFDFAKWAEGLEAFVSPLLHEEGEGAERTLAWGAGAPEALRALFHSIENEGIFNAREKKQSDDTIEREVIACLSFLQSIWNSKIPLEEKRAAALELIISNIAALHLSNRLIAENPGLLPFTGLTRVGDQSKAYAYADLLMNASR